MRIYICILLFIIFYGCESNINTRAKKVNSSQSKIINIKNENYWDIVTENQILIEPKSDNKFYYTINITYENYVLRIKTLYLLDTVIETDAPSFTGFPIATMQIIIFELNNSVIKTINNPVSMIYRTNFNGDKIESPSAIIQGVNLLKGDGGLFFYIEGEGLYHPSYSYTAIYSLLGDLKYEIFQENYRENNGNINTNIIRTYGDFEEVLNEYGTTKDEFIKYQKKTVYFFSHTAYDEYLKFLKK